MNLVITGLAKISSRDSEEVIAKLGGRIQQMRFVHDLERLVVAAVGKALGNAHVSFPVGTEDIGLFIGIDDAIEDIKDNFLGSILKDGILGASPMIFPFTSPNALSAQVSIAYDMRGESITFPIQHSCAHVIKYAADCIIGRYCEIAVAGGITKKQGNVAAKEGHYKAEFYFIENADRATGRGINAIRSVWI